MFIAQFGTGHASFVICAHKNLYLITTYEDLTKPFGRFGRQRAEASLVIPVLFLYSASANLQGVPNLL